VSARGVVLLVYECRFVLTMYFRCIIIYRPESEIFTNAPTDWKSNSMQDAALFIVMNLAAMKSSRDHILELNGIQVLTRITEYNKRARREIGGDLADEQKQLDFQRLKAVSFLLVWFCR